MDKTEAQIVDVNNWQYRGEGNASMVIAHSKERRILKLSKCIVELSLAKDSEAANSEADLKQQLQYVQTVLKPLLGSYVCGPEIVSVTPEFIKSVNEKFNGLRPKERLHKMADQQCHSAVSLPDLSFLHPMQDKCDNPTFCVEIKPKMGFIPTSPWISPEREVKKTVCRYCLQQRLKVNQGTWSDVSKYCPIDLFSGNTHRMKHALYELLKNPQNNLRIFQNGKSIYAAQGRNKPAINEQWKLHQHLQEFFGTTDAEKGTTSEHPLRSSVIESFLDVIVNILLDSKEEIPHHNQYGRNPSVCVCKASTFNTTHKDNHATNQLPHGCVMDVLLQAQKLDDLDIEGVFPLYQRVMNVMETQVTDRDKYQLDWPFDGKVFQRHQMTTGNDKLIPDSVTPSTIDMVTMDTIVHKLRSFLVAGTAKDCSILLAIQPTGVTDRLWNCPHICNHGNNTYLHSCYIIDLDTKPASRIPKYYKLDKEIVDNFIAI